MKRILGIIGIAALSFSPAVSQALDPWQCTDATSCLALCNHFCGSAFSFTGTVVIGTPGNDNLQGGPGNDCIVGNNGNDTITGNQGDDCIITGSGNDVVTGAAGNDRLVDFGGSNRLSGEAGTDVIFAGAG